MIPDENDKSGSSAVDKQTPKGTGDSFVGVPHPSGHEEKVLLINIAKGITLEDIILFRWIGFLSFSWLEFAK
jgi:hypothetical protein